MRAAQLFLRRFDHTRQPRLADRLGRRASLLRIDFIAVGYDRRPEKADTLNTLLWILQALAAFLYGASSYMKVFMFDKISQEAPSFGAMPREAWMALGVLEFICAIGLIVPSALRWQPTLTVVAATILAVESLVFIWVHLKYGEAAPIIMSGVLGLLMAFVAYGRLFLKPIL